MDFVAVARDIHSAVASAWQMVAVEHRNAVVVGLRHMVEAVVPHHMAVALAVRVELEAGDHHMTEAVVLLHMVAVPVELFAVEEPRKDSPECPALT